MPAQEDAICGTQGYTAGYTGVEDSAEQGGRVSIGEQQEGSQAGIEKATEDR